MSIEVNWLEGSGRQIIHFKQRGTWTWQEYDKAVDKIVRMITTSTQYVTVLVDLTGAVTKTRSKEAYQHFTAAQNRWSELPYYAQFFLVLNPSYWARITLFIVEHLTAGLTMTVVTSIDDALEKGLARIAKHAAKQAKDSDTNQTEVTDIP